MQEGEVRRVKGKLQLTSTIEKTVDFQQVLQGLLLLKLEQILQ